MVNILSIRKAELRAVLLSALAFFCILGAYFVLRPVRETMGVQRGWWSLYPLFVATMIVAGFANIAYGYLVSKIKVARISSITFRILALMLAGFAVSLIYLGSTGQQAFGESTGYVFYVWLSVFNVFINAIFWSVMADCWTSDQGKRLFPAIGIGGTLGALLGSLFTGNLASTIQSSAIAVGVPEQSTGLVVAGALMIVSIALLEGAVWALWFVRRVARQATGDIKAPAPQDAKPLGGTAWQGASEVLRSPYLLALCGYILLIAVSSTFLYFTQAELVTEESDDTTTRIQLFANIDIWTQALTLFMQLFIVGHILKRLGVTITLAVLPIVTLSGFIALAIAPMYATLVIVQSLHRTSRYAFARPARETLFTVVPRDEKYKAKAFIDTFVYRGGDVIGMSGNAALNKMIAILALGAGGMLFAVAPLAALWLGISIYLGAQHKHKEST